MPLSNVLRIDQGRGTCERPVPGPTAGMHDGAREGFLPAGAENNSPTAACAGTPFLQGGGEGQLDDLSAEQRIRWALEHLPGNHILSSSFGAQAAVMLHLVVGVKPDMPVVFIDTGYHFPETYRFVDELSDRLQLNLHVRRPRLSPAWQEVRYGERWRQGETGLDAYNRDNKVEPMRRALSELEAGTWFAGLRRDQSGFRETLPIIQHKDGYTKVHPILDWNDRRIYEYLQRHELPYHPLWHKGYVSIGDRQLTRALHEVNSIEETRFFGLKRECGLHE